MKSDRYFDELAIHLPAVRGKIEVNAPLAPYTWFRVGGPADILFTPLDRVDLTEFLAGCPDDMPISVIGVGSNLLVRDGGIPGVSIRLGSEFHKLRVIDQTIVAGAGTPNSKLANLARENSIAGMEFLCGIPGSLGGSISMNAGAFDCEVKDLLEHITVISRSGERVALSSDQINFGYRYSDISSDLIIVEARKWMF